MRVWIRTIGILSILLITKALPVAAQDWQPMGPAGGDVRSMAADPRDPDSIYLGTVDGHIFASKDGGAHWRLIGRAGDRPDTVVMALMVDKRDSRRVYAATRVLGANGGGVYRSDDGGATWRPSGLAGQAVRAIVQSEADPRLMLAGTLDGVYRSRDDGTQWDRISPMNHADLRNFDSLLVDPRNTDVIYAGTFHLPWKTMDGGAHWQSVSAGMIDDSDVMSITLDPTNPDRVYASACSGIYHSDNAGEKWAKYGGIPFPSRRTQIIRQDPANPSIVYAGTTDGLWKTTNSGTTWARVTTPGWTISAVILDTRRAGRIILGVEGLGVYVSRDSGATFSASNDGFTHRQVREVAADTQRPERMLLMLTNAVEPIYATTDGGSTWTSISHGANAQVWRHVFAAPDGWWAAPQAGGLLRYDAVKSNWVQTGVVVAKAAAPAPVARTTKAGTKAPAQTSAQNSAKPATASSAAARPAAGASHPLRSQVYDIAFSRDVWLAATSEGLLASRDHGATWSAYAPFMQIAASSRATVHEVRASADGRSIWLLSDVSLAISRDAGASWATADATLHPKEVERLVIADESTLFALRSTGAVVSHDAGLTWRSQNMPDTQVEDMAVEGSDWVISTSHHGVFVSEDQGRSWKKLTGPLGDGHFPTLTSQAGPRTVIAASATEGLFTLHTPIGASSASLVGGTGGNQQQQ
jgi:photosystem II stability/assembly factor-like uncharacterized protein